MDNQKMRYIKPKTFKMEMMSNEDEPRFPMIDLDVKDIPEAKDWEVGKEYEVTLKVRMRSITDSIKGDDRVCFDILGVETDEDD